MKCQKIYLLWVVLLIGYVPLFAIGQKAHTNPSVQILQPSSEAQSLGDFAEIPVDLYTGRTNINIPLFTISYKDIKVPVSLSYHGGGIKVEDECGVVGLGWTLNAGGVVNRILRGMPDELSDSDAAGYDNLNKLDNKIHTFIQKMEYKTKGVDPANIAWYPTPEEKSLLKWMTNYGMLYDEGHFDTSPDNFIFSAQGLFGAFVNGHTSQAQSNVGCRVSEISDGFSITDVNGLTYKFRKHEKQYYPYKVSHHLWMTDWETLEQRKYPYISAWWLTSIISPSTVDSIDFYYQTIKKRRRSSKTYAYTQYQYLEEGEIERNECNFIAPHNYFMDTVHHQHTLLTQIYTPNSRLVFHYSNTTAQEDIACFIDSISMYAISAENGTMGEILIERYKFTYSGISNRSKLLSITRQGRYGNTQRYNFTYDSSITPGVDEKDHWGYYAKDSRGTFPNKTYLGIIPDKLYNDRVSSRHANNEYATNNMLTSIMYPSGLNVKLTWEPHDFFKWSNLGEGADKEYAYNVKNPLIYDTIVQDEFKLCGKLNGENLSHKVHISSGQYVYLDLLHYFYDSDFSHLMHCVMNWSQDYPNSELPTFSIKWNDQEIYSCELKSSNVNLNVVNNRVNDLIRTYGSGYYTFALANPRSTFLSEHSDARCGLYQEEFNRQETTLGEIPITIFKVTAKAAPTSECYVGGVRIKSIEYTQGSNILLRKEYSYTDSLGYSTGVLSYPPRYASSYPVFTTAFVDGDMGGADATITNEPYGLFLRSNGLPFVLNGGGHIEYEQVNEVITSFESSDKSQDKLNRIEYYYYTSAIAGCSDIDDTNYGTLMPSDMLQLTSQKHRRGHLWKKVEFTDERKITEYNYKVLENLDTVFFTGALFPIADFQAFKLNISDGVTSINAYKNFGIVRYRVIPYNKRLISQKTIGDKTNTYHAYSYKQNTYSSALNADCPLTHTYVTSEGDTLVEHYTYEGNTNKIKQCVTTKNGYVVDGYKLVYDNAFRIVEKYVPLLSASSLPTDDIWRPLETYKYNDSINKIYEVVNHQTNITTTYLWSYRGQYPIAEIVNATLSEVESKIGKSKINELQSSYTPDMSTVNNLRNLLPNASITTMTYAPFVGMTSYTDEKGYTLYYEYDDFGQIKEIYQLVNGIKNILKHFDYQIENR